MILLSFTDIVPAFFESIGESAAETFSYLGTLLPAFLSATVQTLELFALTLIFALPLGLIISLAGISQIKILRAIVKIYIWIFRGTPLMLQLFFMYFFLPRYLPFGIMPDGFQTAVITFVLNYAAYFAEIYRSGIQSIDGGQYEAAKTLGFTGWQTMRFIIIPQTFKRILPPMSNEIITLVKDTALVNVIGVAELMKAAISASNRDVKATPYLLAAVIYLIITVILTVLSRKLEKKFSYYEAATAEENAEKNAGKRRKKENADS